MPTPRTPDSSFPCLVAPAKAGVPLRELVPCLKKSGVPAFAGTTVARGHDNERVV